MLNSLIIQFCTKYLIIFFIVSMATNLFFSVYSNLCDYFFLRSKNKALRNLKVKIQRITPDRGATLHCQSFYKYYDCKKNRKGNRSVKKFHLKMFAWHGYVAEMLYITIIATNN